MKTRDEVIREEIGKDKPVKDYYISPPEGREIRVVKRNGESILQYRSRIDVKFSRETFSYGDWVTEQSYFVWIDVPISEDNYT